MHVAPAFFYIKGQESLKTHLFYIILHHVANTGTNQKLWQQVSMKRRESRAQQGQLKVFNTSTPTAE